MSRFEEAPQKVRDFVGSVIREGEEFRELVGVPIVVLFDLKQRKSHGMMVFGRLSTVSEAMRTLTAAEINEHEGWAYVMFLDKAVWLRAPDDIRRALVAHELRHCLVVYSKDGEPQYKAIGHDIELFEGDLGPDRALPEWPGELAAIAEQAYDHKGKPIFFNPDQGDLLEGLRPEPGSGVESVRIEAGGNVVELRQKGK